MQELPAIEGWQVDVVCADKTGTLTENCMRLSEVAPVSATIPPTGWLTCWRPRPPMTRNPTPA